MMPAYPCRKLWLLIAALKVAVSSELTKRRQDIALRIMLRLSLARAHEHSGRCEWQLVVVHFITIGIKGE